MHRVTRSNECTGICNMNHTKPHNSIHVCFKTLGEELVLKETGKKTVQMSLLTVDEVPGLHCDHATDTQSNHVFI